MVIKQISVFLENKPGQLAEFSKVLEKNHINMRALSIAEEHDFGVLRIIVDDPYNASRVLKDEGYILQITPVLAAEVSDKPGSLVKLLTILGDEGVNLNYTYAFVTRRKDYAYMILRVDNIERAKTILINAGVHLVCQQDINEM